jgi:hypothetical protein
MNTEQFFRDLFGNGDINFRCIRDSDKDTHTPKGKRYNESMINELREWNERNYEIYFVANSGGYRNEHITKINTVFVDLDCGKDSTGQYHPLDVVEQYKKKKMREIEQFPLQPSYIIETRNGYHVYWFVNDGATIEQFERCENMLIAYFDADKQVKNPARLMRVPGFEWRKNPDEPYVIRIIQRNDVRYDIDTIISNIPTIPFSPSDREKLNTLLSIRLPKTPDDSNRTNLNIELIRHQRHDVLKSILSPTPATFNTHDEVYAHLKKMDLRAFLGITDKQFNCIFHDDKHPSATVLVNEENGHHVYHCSSARCGFEGSIIQVTERLIKKGRYSALRFLRKVYDVTYFETDWQREQKELYKQNKDYLLKGDMERYQPEIYQRIKRSIPVIVALHDILTDHIHTEKFTDSRGLPVFYSSKSYIAKYCGKSEGVISDHLALITFLGLVNKLSEDEIPEFMLNTAKQEAAKKKQVNLINYMSIPEYGYDLLEYSKKKAEEFESKGLTLKGLSREALLRAFGEQEADRVYPQMKGRKIPKLNEEVTRELEKAMLENIDQKGWTTENEVVDSIKLYFKGQKRFKETQIKRALPEILEKYGLVRIRLNKQLKQQLNIDIEGYPYIIMRENN